MIKVLNITGLLPVEDIAQKKNENDILLVTEDKLYERYNDTIINHLLILPDTNKFLSLISKKWKSYYEVKKCKIIKIKDRSIFVLGIIQLPWLFSFRFILYEISFQINRKKIKSIIDEIKPTVIHAQNADVDAYLARRIKEVYHIPYVVTLRDLNRIADDTVLLNLKKANKLIAVSPTQVKDANKITSKEIKLIPHGIPEMFFAKNDTIKNQKPLKFISVCRLLKLKNLDLVIEALSQFQQDFIYDIYGDGPEMDNLKNIVSDHNLDSKITFKGIIAHEKLPCILQSYHLFVMPSFPETLGRVYFEAMASGLPVLATKDTGIDGIIHDEKEGFLFDKNRPDSIKEIFNNVFNNSKVLIPMSTYASELAEKYRWDKITSDIHAIYASFSKFN